MQGSKAGYWTTPLVSIAALLVIDKEYRDYSTDPMSQTIAVLTSGGLDSCILVSQLLRQGHAVQPIYLRSGLLWEPAEMVALGNYLARHRDPAPLPLVTLEMPVRDLYGPHWSTTGVGVPPADSPDEDVFLPGRNALLLLKSALWCQLHGVGQLAIATLGSSPFADAAAPFRQRLQALLECYGTPPQILVPFAALDKLQVLQLGIDLPLELTFSCLSPRGELHCGVCNKCGERRAAFRRAGLADRTRYAGHGLGGRESFSGKRKAIARRFPENDSRPCGPRGASAVPGPARQAGPTRARPKRDLPSRNGQPGTVPKALFRA